MASRTAELGITLDPVMSLMFAKQREFQRRLHNDTEPHNLPDVDKMAYIREQALALTDEVHEAMAETGWKSWASSNHINREAYLGELADVFIFWMNLCLVGEITASDIAKVVLEKQFKNHKRQDDGYDGVSTKCPHCKRAYDDKAVRCTPVRTGDMPEPAWCENAEEYVSANGGLL